MIPVHIDRFLAPDQIVCFVGGKLRAGSIEAVERLLAAMDRRPWWRKLLDEFDAYDEAQRQMAPLLAAMEALGAAACRSADREMTRLLAPRFYGENL